MHAIAWMLMPRCECIDDMWIHDGEASRRKLLNTARRCLKLYHESSTRQPEKRKGGGGASPVGVFDIILKDNLEMWEVSAKHRARRQIKKIV